MTGHGRQVAERYSSVARAYERYWAPALLVLGAPLLADLRLEPGAHVLDLGCGTGAVGAAIRQGGAHVTGVDIAHGALKRAKRAGVDAAAGDLLRLPFGTRTFDAAISTFVLQHIARPGSAIAEAARTLRRGGRLAIATWGTDHGEHGGAYEVLDRVFKRRRVPQDPNTLETWHERVQAIGQMRRYIARAGLKPISLTATIASYRWTQPRFVGWATTMGPYGRRFARLEPDKRETVLEELQDGLSALPRDAFVWRPQVIYTLAAR